MKIKIISLSAVIAVLLVLISGCQTIKPVFFGKKSPHEKYADGLKAAGLDSTGMGSRWLAEAERSLHHAIPVNMPYREIGYFAAERVQAVAFALPVRRGEKLVISIDKNPQELFTLYADLWQWEVKKDESSLQLLAWLEEPADSIVHEVKESDTLILRLQPQLLTSGNYTLTITSTPSLSYPFHKAGKRDIQSFYGDPRDGGARMHEGIDLFAPHRTPVLAMADGRVLMVNENMRGGKVVWMKPEGKNYTLYYAHLDSQMVKPLQHVSKGDTIGLLGNTGNAKYTAPHLHLGIYTSGGSVDPLPFVQPQGKESAPIIASAFPIGGIARTASKLTSLYPLPDKKATVIRQLPTGTIVHPEAATTSWHRVSLPDGTKGFVNTKSLADADKPLRKINRDVEQILFDKPDTIAARKGILPPGKSLAVLGNFGEYDLVSNDSTTIGWILR